MSNIALKLVFYGALLGLGVFACTTSTELLEDETASFTHANSTLLFQYVFTNSSSATGDCGGYSMHQWYGSQETQVYITQFYEEQLINSGYVTLQENIVDRWYREDNSGNFLFSTTFFVDEKRIDADQIYYTLPDTILAETTQYNTIYVLGITHFSPLAVKRCSIFSAK